MNKGRFALLGIGLALLVVPAYAGAATINVTATGDNFTDDGQCSLREAVQTASTNDFVNASDVAGTGADCTRGEQAQEDLIQLGATTYTLAIAGAGNDTNQTGDLDIQLGTVSTTAGGPLEIRGQGSSQTEIDAADLDRVMHLTTGPGTLELTDLRLDNGTAPAGERGGALFNNQGNATNTIMDGVRVTNSVSPVAGGGIHWVSNGTLTLTDTTVSGNSVTVAAIGDLGGGIQFANGTLSLTDSAVSGNSATDNSVGIGAGVGGAGIAIRNATMTLQGATVANNILAVTNAIDFPEGGGISAENVTTTMKDSTVSGNSVGGGNIRGGGGFYFSDPTTPSPNNPLTIQNSTFSNNSAGAAANSNGGALRFSGGTATVTASTFSANSSTSSSDAIYSTRAGQTSGFGIAVRSTLFNEGASACFGPMNNDLPLTSAGYNRDAGTTCGLNTVTDGQNSVFTLGGLASNGGPTQTHALTLGSGLNAIPPADCVDANGDPLGADQRGVPRPQGPGCEVGAYELGPTCNGQASTIIGTDAGETIAGTNAADVIVAGDGADTVNAGDGADTVCAGDGDDTVRPGTGADNDVALGQGGTDTVSFSDLGAGLTAATIVDLPNGSASGADAGNDTLNGFENLTGTPFNDQSGATGLTGNAGANTIDGLAGNDIIQGLADDDTLIGGAGTDTATWLSLGPVTASLATGTASGVQGNDTLSEFENLTGSPNGDDVLTGDDGPNTLNGFTGTTNTFDGRGGADQIQGSNSPVIDTVTYANQPGPVTVNLVAGTVSGAQGNDSILGGNMDNVIGSPDGDTITGNDAANTLSGGGGGDTLNDGSLLILNPDVFQGGAGTDVVSYANRGPAAHVQADLNLAADNGGQAGENDDLAADIEGVAGGAGTDLLIGDEGANPLSGNGGADTLDGRGGADPIDGGDGTDVADYSALVGPVTAHLDGTPGGGAQGADTLSTIENLLGSPDDDILNGDAAANTISGSDGEDLIDGRQGTDVLDGGGDSDTVSFAGVNELVNLDLGGGTVLGQGNDSLTSFENAVGSPQGDTFVDDASSANRLDGGPGTDLISYDTASGPVTVSLATGTGPAGDELVSFANVQGGPFSDTLTGNANANAIAGGDGGDVITAGLGQDDVHGQGGGDQLLVRDGVSDNVDCGPGDLATDSVASDLVGVDVIANCDNDTVTFAASVPNSPVLTGTDPASPANQNRPRIRGTTGSGTTVSLYATAGCTGAPVATGSEAQFEGTGITVTVPDNSTTTFRATATGPGGTSACSASSVTYAEVTPPNPPVLTGSDPRSPADQRQPRIKGATDAGTTVRLYTNANCSGAPVATGSEAQLEGTGIPVTVPHNSTTTFRATAAGSGGTSACSQSAVSYIERCKKGFKLKIKRKGKKPRKKCVRKKKRKR